MNFTKAHFIKNRPKDPAGVQLTKRKTAKVNLREINNIRQKAPSARRGSDTSGAMLLQSISMFLTVVARAGRARHPYYCTVFRVISSRWA